MKQIFSVNWKALVSISSCKFKATALFCISIVALTLCCNFSACMTIKINCEQSVRTRDVIS